MTAAPPAASRLIQRPLRGALLMPVCALAVHQLRYWLAYGPTASRELAEQGHSYLRSLTPWIVLCVGLALGGFLGRLALARRAGDGRGARRGSFRRVWLGAAVALLALYCCQELLEGWFATGHPQGVVGIFGNGGLWAIPVAVVVGGLFALTLRGAAVALALVAVRGRRPTPRLGVRRIVRRWDHPAARRLAPMAASAPGRAPPRLAPTAA